LAGFIPSGWANHACDAHGGRLGVGATNEFLDYLWRVAVSLDACGLFDDLWHRKKRPSRLTARSWSSQTTLVHCCVYVSHVLQLDNVGWNGEGNQSSCGICSILERERRNSY
jgi:hypothetical protein